MRITFVDSSGTKIVIEARPDESVMAAAVRNGIEGIVGECGGSLSCATCHVYAHPPEGQENMEPDEMEDAMLDGTASERRSNSRLCCQIRVNEAVDGWEFELPDSQY